MCLISTFRFLCGSARCDHLSVVKGFQQGEMANPTSSETLFLLAQAKYSILYNICLGCTQLKGGEI